MNKYVGLTKFYWHYYLGCGYSILLETFFEDESTVSDFVYRKYAEHMVDSLVISEDYDLGKWECIATYETESE